MFLFSYTVRRTKRNAISKARNSFEFNREKRVLLDPYIRRSFSFLKFLVFNLHLMVRKYGIFLVTSYMFFFAFHYLHSLRY